MKGQEQSLSPKSSRCARREATRPQFRYDDNTLSYVLVEEEEIGAVMRGGTSEQMDRWGKPEGTLGDEGVLEVNS